MQQRNSRNAQGIDVSHHNGKIDWQKVAADGRAFALIKASEGKTYQDNQLQANVQGAKAVGLLVGVYHFFNATTVQTAVLEAQNLYAAIKKIGGVEVLDFPPILDYENNPGGISKAQINAVAKAFLTETERLTGKKAMIYTGNSFATNFDISLGTYKLWIARYSSSAPYDTPAWKRWDIWQYSESGKVPGIGGNVDLNEFNGTKDDLKLWLGKKEGTKVAERDITKVSDWAAAAWDEMTENGYIDGTRPGDKMSREEGVVIFNRLRKNFLTLIGGNTERIAELEQKLQGIEKGDK